MGKKKNSLKSSSTNTKNVGFYLPNDCWEHVFKFLDNSDNNCRYLESLSLVSKQFLSITNNLKFSLTINYHPPGHYLRQIFQRFTNLTSLDLTRFHGHLHAPQALLCEISRFPIHNLNLKSLKISYRFKFPEIGLRNFSKKITTLTSLTIFSIHSLCDYDLILISDCFPLLEEFDISNTISNDITDIGVKIMSMGLPKLRKVNLSSLYNIHDSSLLDLCKNCEFLEELIMLKCPFLTHEGIASAVRERPGLKSLSITWTPNGNHDNIGLYFIDSLVSLKDLTCLHLSNSFISDQLLFFIAMRGLPLRRLGLKNCIGYSFDGIFCLLSKCQCIQHLELQNAMFLDDDQVSKISSLLGDLVSINLSHCSSLTDSTLFALIKNCHSLSEIKMKHTSIGTMSLEDSNSMMNNVTNPQLKSLCLAHNSSLRDENIIMLASICPNLQLLDLSSCNGISEGIGEVLRCCKIRHLNLARCSGVELLKMNFKVSTVEVLNLSDTKIDDRSLYAISNSCFGLLQLNLGHCDNVTDKGVKEVIDKCKKLREINLEHCRKLGANVLDQSMVFKRPSLRKITAYPVRFSDIKRKLFLRHGCFVCVYWNCCTKV